MARGYLILEDGTVYEGSIFGHPSSASGEVVFTTGMSGYQEIITDPSCHGQLLVMSYPLIGDCGIVEGYSQSDKVQIGGLIVREHCAEPTEAYGGTSLDSFLEEHGVPGISGIDTRDLVIRIREQGTMKGSIVSDGTPKEEVLEKLKSLRLDSGKSPVAEVSVKEIHSIDSGKDLTVGVLDCGSRAAIIDNLASRFNVVIFPYDTPYDVITARKVDGLVMTNGPGDPSHKDILNTVVKTGKDLIGVLPMYGICFGSQTLALSLGAETYKMSVGHRGNNQPVLFEDRVYITSQNHGYAVSEESLEGTDFIADHINVNDGTVEGCSHRDLPVFTTQYHPEAGPGPADTLFLFDRFGKIMKEGKK